MQIDGDFMIVIEDVLMYDFKEIRTDDVTNSGD